MILQVLGYSKFASRCLCIDLIIARLMQSQCLASVQRFFSFAIFKILAVTFAVADAFGADVWMCDYEEFCLRLTWYQLSLSSFAR